MTLRAKLYIGSVFACAVLAVAALAVYGLRPSGSELAPVAFLCAMGALASCLRHKLPTAGAEGSIATVPFLAAALVSPTWVSVLAIGATMSIAYGVRRQPLYKLGFNVAQSALALTAAIVVYVALGGRPVMAVASLPWLPAWSLIAVYGLSTSLTVAGVIAVTQSRPLSTVWRANVISTVIYDAIASPLVIGLAWVNVHYGVVWATSIALTLVATHHLYAQNQQLASNAHEFLALMVKAIEARDPYTSGHSRRVSQMAMTIARAIKLSEREVQRIGTAGLLHDVGKIHEKYAPILRKPDKLTTGEWATMKEHPADGVALVATVSQLRDLLPSVRHHHENWDGSGYPDNLKGEAIPLWARVIMFADTIDAMTSDRPYRRALTEVEVRSEVIRCRGKQFDPEIADKLLVSPLWPSLFRPANVEDDHARFGLRVLKIDDSTKVVGA